MNMPIDTVSRCSAQLRSDGYVVIPNALPASTIARLDADLAPTFERTPFCQGAFYGETTKRFGRLLSRSPRMAELVQNRTILGIVEDILLPWCDTIQLNVAQAIAVHPGAPAQLPHRDQKQSSHAPAPRHDALLSLKSCHIFASRVCRGCLGPNATDRLPLVRVRKWPVVAEWRSDLVCPA